MKDKPYMNPYFAGFLLGLVLLVTIYITGRGLGASGAIKDTVYMGTPGYAPPEQYGRGQSDARSDIYALGATLHQLLTLRDPGDEPFKFPPLRSLNPRISQHVEAAIQRALEQEPVRRWNSTHEFWQALEKPAPIPPTAPLRPI